MWTDGTSEREQRKIASVRVFRREKGSLSARQKGFSRRGGKCLLMTELTRKTLRIAVAGCVAGRVRYGATLAASPEIVIVALTDTDQVASRVWAREIGGRLPVFDTLDALLASPLEFDALLIASPLPERTEAILKAAQAGKAILCEIPFGASLPETDSVLRHVHEKGILLMPAMPLRFDSLLNEMTRQTEAETLGALKQARCEWSYPRPGAQKPDAARVLLEYVACQAIDVSRLWLGEALSISADIVLPGMARTHDETLATILTTHARGQSTLRLASTGSPQASERYTLIGSEGQLELVSGSGVALSAPQLTLRRVEQGAEPVLYPSEDAVPVAVGRRFRLLHHFSECVLAQAIPQIISADARAAQEIFAAAVLSAAEGLKVSLPLRSSSMLSLPTAPGNKTPRAITSSQGNEA